MIAFLNFGWKKTFYYSDSKKRRELTSHPVENFSRLLIDLMVYSIISINLLAQKLQVKILMKLIPDGKEIKFKTVPKKQPQITFNHLEEVCEIERKMFPFVLIDFH
jgi:hypothetical protein